MGLDTYWKKRDFAKTSEPHGDAKTAKKAAGKGNSARRAVHARTEPRAEPDRELSFVVQKHAATRLHYDFRLELDGVLKSWAVPKGPSLDPGEKRLAVEVEDHPIEYGGFEGTIPKGEYGGGAVIVWDRGEWTPEGDPREGYRRGKIAFKLSGEKLHGGFTLVRLGGRRGGEEGEKNWLLIKAHDEDARSSSAAELTAEEPLSVLTGRSVEEVAAPSGSGAPSQKTKGRAAVKKEAAKKAVVTAASRRRSPESIAKPAEASVREPDASRVKAADPSRIEGARKEALPRSIEPQLATLVDKAPTSPGWVYELKYDGYRVLARIDDGEAQFFTRNGNDWTEQFVSIKGAVESLPATSAILDGEVVVMRPDGTTDFQALQNALREGRQAKLVYFAFDLLHLNGYDLRGARLQDRKAALAALLLRARGEGAEDSGPVRFSDHLGGEGAAVHKQACRLALEGVVAKRIDSKYRSGRSGDWLKLKCGCRQEVVIGGYTDPSGSRKGFGALLVGVHAPSGDLQYAGKVGTGFTEATLRELAEELRKLEAASSPFADSPRMRGAHWVKPQLVGEVEFTGWTEGGHLRHPSFQGLREDKKAVGILREIPQHLKRDESVSGKGSGGGSAAEKEHKPAARTGRRPAPIEVAGVTLSNPDKVLYPEVGVTKLDLAQFYERIAEWILPHIEGRPLTLVRCPNGQKGPSFFQKHVAAGTPPEVQGITIKDKEGSGKYLYISSLAGLISLVQMGALELHVWGSRTDKLEQPDRLVFDLDPAPDLAWSAVMAAARDVRERLLDLDLQSFVKTTGGKGLHVVVPLARGRIGWDELKGFSKAVATAMAGDSPKLYTATMSKAKRVGRIFIDYLRNGRGATAVSSYSTRSKPGATVATPLSWEELVPSLQPERFNLEGVSRRLADLAQDPWDELWSLKQSITDDKMRRIGMPR